MQKAGYHFVSCKKNLLSKNNCSCQTKVYNYQKQFDWQLIIMQSASEFLFVNEMNDILDK